MIIDEADNVPFCSFTFTFKAKCHYPLIEMFFIKPATRFMRHYVQAGPWAEMLREG